MSTALQEPPAPRKMRTDRTNHDQSRRKTRTPTWARRPCGAAGVTGREVTSELLTKSPPQAVRSQVLSGGRAGGLLNHLLVTCQGQEGQREAEGGVCVSVCVCVCVCVRARACLCTCLGSQLYVPWSCQELFSWKQKLPLRATPRRVSLFRELGNSSSQPG